MKPEEAVEEVPFDSAIDLVNYLRPSNPVWGADRDNPWVFRGHRDAEWELKPCAWRKDGEYRLKPVSDFFDSLAREKVKRRQATGISTCDSEVEVIKSIAAQLHVLEDFVSLANEIGIGEGLNPFCPTARGFLGHTNLRYDFQRKEETAFAQHHGIPTFLLDWTHDPFTATFFAAAGDQTTDQTTAQSIAIWAYDTRVDMGHIGISRYEPSGALTRYAHAQRSVFLYHEKGVDWRMSKGCWPSILNALQEEGVSRFERQPFRKVTLPRDQCNALLRILWRERKTLAHLMPSPDNVAKTVMKSGAALLSNQDSDP